MKAVFNQIVIAESEETVVVEGNHYFAPETINREYFKDSDTHTTCPWKGQASYFHIVTPDKSLHDGAWYYPEPKEAAAKIKGRIAFDKQVEVIE